MILIFMLFCIDYIFFVFCNMPIMLLLAGVYIFNHNPCRISLALCLCQSFLFFRMPFLLPLAASFFKVSAIYCATYFTKPILVTHILLALCIISITALYALKNGHRIHWDTLTVQILITCIVTALINRDSRKRTICTI